MPPTIPLIAPPAARGRNHDMMRPFVVMHTELMPFMDGGEPAQQALIAGHGSPAEG
jgi:hypothetical protein